MRQDELLHCIIDLIYRLSSSQNVKRDCISPNVIIHLQLKGYTITKTKFMYFTRSFDVIVSYNIKTTIPVDACILNIIIIIIINIM